MVDLNSNLENNSKSNLKEKEKKLSFIQLYRYSNGLEKFMTIFGVIFSFIQGSCMPLM